MAPRRLAATLLLWCVVTSAAFWAVGAGAGHAVQGVRWYQACERVLPAQDWSRRGALCGGFVLRSIR